jgi:iron complex transport system substrate-binding protein
MGLPRTLVLALTAIIAVAIISALAYVFLQPKYPREETGVTVVDQLGRVVHVKRAERIVSLWPEATRVLFALGVGNKVVGLDTHSRTCPILTRAFPWIKNVTDVGSITAGFDLEKIAQLKPDVIFTRTDDPKFVEDLQAKLGVPVIAVRFNPPGKEKEWNFDIITVIGKAVGRENRAKELREFLEKSSTKSRI